MERVELLRARITQASADADNIAVTLLGGANATLAASTHDAEFWMRSLEMHLADATRALGHLEAELRKPAKETA